MRTIKKWRSQHSPNHFWLDGADDVLAVLEGCSIVRAITGGEIRQAGKRHTCKVVIEQCEHRHRPMILLWYYATTSAKNQFVIIANRAEGMTSDDILDALCAELEPYCIKNNIEFFDRRKAIESVEETENVVIGEICEHQSLINVLLLQVERTDNTAETLELTDLLKFIRDKDELMAMQSLRAITTHLDAYDRTNDQLRQQVVGLRAMLEDERLQNRPSGSVCVNGNNLEHRSDHPIKIEPLSNSGVATTAVEHQLKEMARWVESKRYETTRQLKEAASLVRHLDQLCLKGEARLSSEQLQATKIEEERTKLLEAIVDAATKAEIESIGTLYESLKKVDVRQTNIGGKLIDVEQKLDIVRDELLDHRVSMSKLEVMEKGLTRLSLGLMLSLDFAEMLNEASGDYEKIWKALETDINITMSAKLINFTTDEAKLADSSRRQQERLKTVNRAERRANERGKTTKKKRSPWMGGGK